MKKRQRRTRKGQEETVGSLVGQRSPSTPKPVEEGLLAASFL